MKIENHRLVHDDGTPFPYVESPNVSGVLHPRYLVIHYTAAASAQRAVEWLTNINSNASAHLVISREGEITQLVPFDTVAWHAGASSWEGLEGLNKYSIGVELDNAGRLSYKNERWAAL